MSRKILPGVAFVLVRLAFVLALSCVWACVASARTQPRRAPLAGSRQLIVVTTRGWDTVQGTLRRFERRGGGSKWTQVGEAFPVVVGRSGLGWGAGLFDETHDDGPSKREGDGRAPAGVFALTRAFGFAGEAAWLRVPYTPLTPGVECVDDTASAHYNRVVDRAAVGAVDWNSSERLREVDAYVWGLVVAHNERAVPGRGSCIFLHVWAGPSKGTAGCTAMERPSLESLMRWLDSRKRPLLVQLTESDYARLRTRLRLPAFPF